MSPCLASAKWCGLNVVGDEFHQFEPHGATGTVLLAESISRHSHLAEIGFVMLDVCDCNFQTDNTDNTDKAVALYSALKDHF